LAPLLLALHLKHHHLRLHLLVESIPKFEGSATDFPQDFIDHVNRIADAEVWNELQNIQVAARRLE